MFWFFIVGLLLIAVGYLVLPFFRQDEATDDRKTQNILIVREQMTELEGSFERGEIESEQYRERRDELEQTLLSDVSGQGDEAVARAKTSSSSWVSAGFVALFVPVATVGLYLYLGTPNAMELAERSKKPEIPMTADGKPDVDKLLVSLHDKLRKAPDNAEGWYMLGRSYMMLQRFEGATEAYENLYRLQPDEPDVMLMLADSLSMQQQGKMTGKPEVLINKALARAPQNKTALWLSGMALEQQGKYQEAIDRWAGLKPLLKDDPEEQVQLDVLINRAKAQLSGGAKASASAPTTQKVDAEKAESESPQTQSGAATVTLTVSISDAFAKQVSPDDSVFIYAKAQSGPPMPLAASRLKVKDLPTTVTLGDDMAMMPQFKLSAFKTVIVGARVSKSGNAVGQAGDLYIEQEQVSHGDEVTLVINQILKK